MNNSVLNKAKSILDKDNRKNNLINLRTLFSNDYFYRIPDYQRGYSWNKEFEDLWNDIIRLYHSENKERMHYMGMLTLDELDISSKKNEKLEETSSFYIVDGQQRLTSLVIILQTIISYAKDSNITEISDNANLSELLITKSKIKRLDYSKDRNDDSNDYFDKRIFNNDKTVIPKNQYFVNIDFAASFVEKELNKYYDNLQNIINIILDKLVFNLYFITEEFDVRVTFETMNNRGKSLTSLELLKNRLMFLSTYFKRDSNNYGGRIKDKINSAWKIIYENLSYEDSKLSDDEYLRAHWIVYKRLNKKKGDSYIHEILEDEFAIDKGNFYELCKEEKYNEAFINIDNYITSLEKYSKYWAFVNIPNLNILHIPKDEYIWIERLSMLPNLIYLKAATMVVLASKVNVEERKKFYEKIEQFVFINKLLAQDNNDLSFLISHAKDLLNAKEENQTKILNDLIKSIDEHELHIDKNRIIESIKAFGLYINKKKNYFYDWRNGLIYFLYEYNNSLSISIKDEAPINNRKLNSASIEHVLPQTIKRDYWKTAFSEYINTEEEAKIKNSLGNLLLLSSGAENSSLQDYSFPVKKDMDINSKKFAYSDGSRSAREIAQNANWTSKEVYDRTIKLLNFMRERWFKNYIEEDEWDKLIKSNNLVNFKYKKLSENQYNKLIDTLNKIDVSDERAKASSIANESNDESSFSRELREFYDNEYFRLKPNNKSISYLDNIFTYLIVCKDNSPQIFKCGIRIQDIKYKIEYNYKTNYLIIEPNKNNNLNNCNLSELPKIIQAFIHRFKIYLRKARMIDIEPNLNIN